MTDSLRAENIESAVHDAEGKIQKILIDLENDFGIEIEQVDVDTRDFSNLRVDIFTVG